MAGGGLERLVILLVAVFSSATAHADDIAGQELRFLEGPITPPPHLFIKHIAIRPDSLATGWIVDRQCHENLDPVPAMEIVFVPGRVRNLRITRSKNIGSASVVGSSVQLENIGHEAELCLESENRVLTFDSALNQYVLKTGPFMRRFLDGYFPMQVTLDIHYPAQMLRMVDLQPAMLRNGARTPPGRIQLEALFEGELRVRFGFEKITAKQDLNRQLELR